MNEGSGNFGFLMNGSDRHTKWYRTESEEDASVVMHERVAVYYEERCVNCEVSKFPEVFFLVSPCVDSHARADTREFEVLLRVQALLCAPSVLYYPALLSAECRLLLRVPAESRGLQLRLFQAYGNWMGHSGPIRRPGRETIPVSEHL